MAFKRPLQIQLPLPSGVYLELPERQAVLILTILWQMSKRVNLSKALDSLFNTVLRATGQTPEFLIFTAEYGQPLEEWGLAKLDEMGDFVVLQDVAAVITALTNEMTIIAPIRGTGRKLQEYVKMLRERDPDTFTVPVGRLLIEQIVMYYNLAA